MSTFFINNKQLFGERSGDDIKHGRGDCVVSFPSKRKALITSAFDFNTNYLTNNFLSFL